MGDLLSPRRRDVFDRLRRRIESYRQHHVSRVNQRFDSLANGLYKQQQRDTVLLHQRLLESKAKRSQKSSSSSKSSRSAGNVDPASNVAPAGVEPGSVPPQTPAGASHLPHNKLKRKLGTGGATESTSVKVGGSTEPGLGDLSNAVSSASTVGRNDSLHSVSVNIVHEINSAASAHAQIKNHIKLTVSSTLHTGGAPASSAASGNLSSPSGVEGHHADTNAHPSTSGLSLPNVCKREPQEEVKCSPPSDGFPETIGIADVDELQAILDTLEKEGDITPELMKEFDLELKDVEAGLSQQPAVKEEETRGRSGSTSGNNPATGRGTFADSCDASATNKGSPASGVQPAAMFPDPIYPGGGNPQGGQNFNGMVASRGGAARYAGGRAPAAPAAQPQLLTSDTGPAAETLKQMAAQHQNHKSDVPYVPKQSMTPYRADGFSPDGYMRRMPAPHPGGGYPGYPPQGYSPVPQNGMYPAYSQQMVNGMPRPPVMSKQDPSLTYGATKPLCHYSEPMMAASMSPANPSSLQQLQNQVQSHFGGAGTAPSPGDMRMELGHAQHMQMTHAGQQVVMSQTQHMQYSNTGLPPGAPMSANPQQEFGGGVPGTPPAYMTEQMKMQQLYQEKMMQQHHQQQQMQQSSAAYMARPPPEYKVHPDGGAPNYPTQRVNPLETMQHMVNQKSPPPGGVMSAATSRASPGMKGNAQYPAGHPMMPSGQMALPTPTSASHRRTAAKTVGSVYTSALMRGQRPPNVNVGPEGLNISQQRGSHKANWHRPMLGGATVPMPMRPHMPGGGMPSAMHYGSYGSQQGMPHPQMQYTQQQQAAMAASAAAAAQQRTAEIADGMRVPQVHSQMAQQSTTMMVGQQQHVHMRSAHGVVTDMNMSQSISMTTNGAACPPVALPGANASFPGQSLTVAPPAGASGSQFPLDFLDNPSANGTNYYNEQHGGGAQDLYFMDDLFPGT